MMMKMMMNGSCVQQCDACGWREKEKGDKKREGEIQALHYVMIMLLPMTH